jgi:hypothetical protein
MSVVINGSAGVTSGTAVASTSGTSIDFTWAYDTSTTMWHKWLWVDSNTTQTLGTGAWTGASGIVAGNITTMMVFPSAYIEASAEL